MSDWCVFTKLLLLAGLCYIKTKHYNLFYFKTIIIMANIREKANKINLKGRGSFYSVIPVTLVLITPHRSRPLSGFPQSRPSLSLSSSSLTPKTLTLAQPGTIERGRERGVRRRR